MHQRKYDLVFSLSQACSCTSALRKANLQVFSYPFDWLFGSDFSGRIDILCNDFEGFLNKDDLVFSGPGEVIKTDVYKNPKNGLVFNHDFQTGLSLDEAYPLVQEKYNRRISRLSELIEQARHVLVVFIETPDTPLTTTGAMLKKGQKKLHKRFGEKMDLLYIQIRRDIPFRRRQDIYITDAVRQVSFDYDAHNKKHAYMPKYGLLLKILKEYQRTGAQPRKGKTKLKTICARLISGMIPLPKYRRAVRQKLMPRKGDGSLSTDME